jgi:hypothetical protein
LLQCWFNLDRHSTPLTGTVTYLYTDILIKTNPVPVLVPWQKYYESSYNGFKIINLLVEDISGSALENQF